MELNVKLDPMEKQIDICATCVHDEPGYCSVIGTIPHCCSRHWHCEPGKAAKDYVPKQVHSERGARDHWGIENLDMEGSE